MVRVGVGVGLCVGLCVGVRVGRWLGLAECDADVLGAGVLLAACDDGEVFVSIGRMSSAPTTKNAAAMEAFLTMRAKE